MATTTEKYRNFTVATGQTVLKCDRIKLTAGANPPTISVAGAGEDYHGVALRAGAAGKSVECKLRHDSGTTKYRSAGAIVALAKVYGAADGEIDDAPNGEIIGIALEATANANEYLEVLHWNNLDNVISQIDDVSGNELLSFTTTTSAVNEIDIANAATGNNPTISCFGEADTGITFENLGGEEILILDSVASSVNELTIASAATGNNPTVACTGEVDTGITFQNSQGEEILILDSIATSVNELTIKSAATGNKPIIASTGESDNGIEFHNDQGEEILILNSAATSVNELTITSGATGIGATVGATGETNVSINMTPNGTGDVVLTTGHVTMGDGGTVTQGTNKTTAVTKSTESGQITMHNAQLNAAAEASFTVTNTCVGATDVVIVNHGSAGTAGAYIVTVTAVAAGSFEITVANVSAGNLSEAIVINFAVLGGSAT